MPEVLVAESVLGPARALRAVGADDLAAEVVRVPPELRGMGPEGAAKAEACACEGPAPSLGFSQPQYTCTLLVLGLHGVPAPTIVLRLLLFVVLRASPMYWAGL